MATISPASKSIEIAKAIRDIDLKVGQADLKGKAADLISALADVKISLVEANDQLHAAEKEIERLKETLRRKDQLVESRGFLYRSRTDGSPQGNPACPVCLEKEARIFFTTPTHDSGRPLQCPNCRAKYFDATEYLYEGDN